MKLAIVAYPALDAIDRQRIEAFRAAHDPQAARIGVHFTLVFPFEGEPDEPASDMTLVAASSEPIAFAIDRTEVVRDPFGNGCHVFLVPGEGADRISGLHDCLYAGALRRHLRADIPFVPHLTVATTPDIHAAERLAASLDVRARTIRGAVTAVDLVDVGLPHVRSMAASELGPSRERPPGSSSRP